MSKDSVLHRLWTKDAYTDDYNKEDWKKLESLVHAGIKAKEVIENLTHQRDQYDARRRESIAKYEELRLEHQRLKENIKGEPNEI